MKRLGFKVPLDWVGSGQSQRGSSLVIAMLILGALAVLGLSIAVISMGDRNLSRYDRHSVQALALAETGVAHAKAAIVNLSAPMEDADADGRPDFVLSDTLSWGGSYEVVAEASDITGVGITAYRSNGFTIISEGRYFGATRRVKVEIVHDSFLKFARFVSIHSLQYECGDLIAGEVYTGGSLTLSCGCPVGQEPHFLEHVYAVGPIPQASCGNFERGYVEFGEPIDFLNSVDWDDARSKSRGLAAENSCDGRGDVGIYFSLPGTDPLSLGTQPGADQNVLVFDKFDFMDMASEPPDTVVAYNGVPVVNTVTGQALRRSEFNGLIFFEGDARIRGTLDGKAGYPVSIFGLAHGLITGDVIAGHVGFDPITGLPNGSGDPVSCALICEDYIAMTEYTKRVLRVDAALFSRTSNWRCLGGIGDHPVAGPGPLDLDIDGVWGETPYNNDPVAGEGWDELNITDKTWVLNTTGPILTYSGGDAYPWTAGPVLGQASGPTRRQTYDLDFQSFPPPCFPVPINLWEDVSWTEIFDVRSALASQLPS